MSTHRPWPRERGALLFALMSLGLGCIGTDGPNQPAELVPGGGSEVVPVGGSTSPAPAPTPLEEIDLAALPELEPEPEPEPSETAEPLPFDAEQLERIYAVQAIVNQASATHGVDATLINGLIWVESKFEQRARGPAGAQGLMQLMPKTASSLAKRLERKRNSWDPDFNINAGALMISRLLERFDGDVRLALAGYNRGGGTVSKWVANGDPLPEGAEKFVARVLAAQALFQRLPAQSQPQTEPTAEPLPSVDP